MPLHGVFQGQQARAGKVKIIGLDSVEHLLQVQRTIGLYLQRLWLNGAQHCRTATFVLIGMGLLTDDVLVAAFTVRHKRQQIAHGARRHEQRGIKPEASGERRFEQIDRRVLAVDVIANGRTCHGIKHAGRGQSHCVAAQIDDSHEKAP